VNMMLWLLQRDMLLQITTHITRQVVTSTDARHRMLKAHSHQLQHPHLTAPDSISWTLQLPAVVNLTRYWLTVRVHLLMPLIALLPLAPVVQDHLMPCQQLTGHTVGVWLDQLTLLVLHLMVDMWHAPVVEMVMTVCVGQGCAALLLVQLSCIPTYLALVPMIHFVDIADFCSFVMTV